jgi:WD40 repeat protein/serine/threonine protein kinase
MNEEQIFAAALEKRNLSERSAFLDAVCADPAMRQRVETLLQAQEKIGNFLERPAVEQMAVVVTPFRGDTVAVEADAPGQNQDAQPQDPRILATTQAEAGGQEEDDAALGFLQPSQKPGSLGRLAHYEVLEVLGHGGFGTVVKAFDEKLHRIVAIKIMSPQLAATSPARKRFVREARTAAAIRHENIVDIHAVEEQPIPYLVMEYVGGETLQQKLDRIGPLEVPDVLRLGQQIARGLSAAHGKGLIHRDIKPANILLEAGVEEKVKITDFGLARAADDASMTQSGVIAGTPMYMAPEQARGEVVDQRADLFSLGSVLYVMCSGRPPFRASTALAVLKRVAEHTARPIREIIPEVPEWLCAIVAKLHAKDPAERFPSAAGVAELLAQHLAHVQQPQVAPLPRPFERKRPAGRRLWQPAVAAGVLLAILGAFGAYLWFNSDEPAPLVDIPKKDAPKDKLPVQLTLEELLKLPSPLDGRQREDIPRGHLAVAGGGNPDQAPQELVAVLGEFERLKYPDNAGRAWMAQSIDGKMLAVTCGPTVVLFDAKTGELLRTLPGAKGRVFSVAFSPDSTRLVSGAAGDQTVRVWNTQTGQVVASFTGHNVGVWAVAFNSDGKRIVSGGENGSICVWEADTGKEVFCLTGHTGLIFNVAFSPDGKRIASASFDKTARIWDADTRKELGCLTAHTAEVRRVEFSGNGKLLATGSDAEMILWDADTLKQIKTLSTPAGWLAFDPDGQTLLTGSHESGGKVHKVTRWNIATGQEVASYPLEGRDSWALYQLSPDGKTLFATRDAADVPYVRAYDAATGKELFPQSQPIAGVSALAVSPDGKLLASAADRFVQLWELDDWKAGQAKPPARILSGHNEGIPSLAFSPDGKLLASGSTDSTIILWDVASGKEQRTLTGHSRENSRLAFSPDGQTIAAGGSDGFVRFWDVKTGAEKTPQRLHTGIVRVVAYSPDGKWIASGGADRLVQLVETATGRRQLFRPGTTVTSLAFSRDSQTLFAVTDGPNAVLRSWNLETKKETLLGGTETVHTLGLAVHPAGELLATSNRSGVVRFWHLPSGAALTAAVGDKPRATFVDHLAFTPEGRYLAVGHPNGTISIYRTPAPPRPYDPGLPRKLPDPLELAKQPSPADKLDRKDIPVHLFVNFGMGKVDAPLELVAILTHGEKQVMSVAISPDGKLLASGTFDGTAKLWDLTTGKLLHTCSHQSNGVNVAFVPGRGKEAPLLLATAGANSQTVKLWDAATGQELRTLTGHTDDVWQATSSPDGRWLASFDKAGTIHVWDPTTGKHLRTIWTPLSPFGDLAVSPDSRVLATAGADGAVRLWDPMSGWMLATLPGHQGLVRGLAFLPDGRTLASSSDIDHSIRLWDLPTLRQTKLLEGTRTLANKLAWRADGRLLASNDVADGTVRLWDPTAEPAKCRTIRLFPASALYVHGVALTPEGRYLATANPDGTIYILRLADPGVVFAPTADGGPKQQP